MLVLLKAVSVDGTEVNGVEPPFCGDEPAVAADGLAADSPETLAAIPSLPWAVVVLTFRWNISLILGWKQTTFDLPGTVYDRICRVVIVVKL